MQKLIWKIKLLIRSKLTFISRKIPRIFLKLDNAHFLLQKMDSWTYLNVWFIQPLNGQFQRMRTIQHLAQVLKPDIVVETGTYVGSSTPLLATFASKTLFTIEKNPIFLKQAQTHFVHLGAFAVKINPFLGDSCEVLNQILID